MTAAAFAGRALLIVLVFGWTESAYALRPPSNYACLAKEADNIAIVRARGEPQKVYEDYFGVTYYLLQLDVKKQIYLLPGLNGKSLIQLLSRGMRSPEDAHFDPEFNYLVFLKNGVNGPYVIDGSQGALPFRNGKVELRGRLLSPNQLTRFVESAQRLEMKCAWHRSSVAHRPGVTNAA